MATIVDFCCKGPGLLSAVPAKHNRIAVIDDGDLRTKIIISKKLLDVKIVERSNVNILKNMKDLNIIMNPPYDGSLHLKILNNVIKTFPEAKIVNLSPIRWLEDPLAEYKKNSDYKKFENLRKHIEDINVITAREGTKIFNIDLKVDLGIYTIVKDGCWKNTFKNSLVEKILNKAPKTIKTTTVSKANNFILLSTIVGNNGLDNLFKDSTIVRTEYMYGKYFINGKSEKNGLSVRECKTSYNGNPDNFCCVEVDPNEIENVYKYFWTKTFRYMLRKTTVDVHVHPEYLPYMNDYTHEWTDEMLYEYFELTEDEIKIIENEIK